MLKIRLVNIAVHTSADLLVHEPPSGVRSYLLSPDEVAFFRSTLSPYLHYSYFGVLGEYGQQQGVSVYSTSNAVWLLLSKSSAE